MILSRLRNFRDRAQVYQDELEEKYKNRFIEKERKYRKRLKKATKLPPLKTVLKIRNAMFFIAGCCLLPAVYVVLFWHPVEFYPEAGNILVWIEVGGLLFFLFGLAVESAIVKRFERDDVCWVYKK